MGNIVVSEICNKCARCCKNYPFVELSHNEIYALEKLTGLPFDAFTNQKGETNEEYFLQFKENGDCFFLNENNGEYFCSVYEARSGICRNYPSTPSQNEACDANRKMILRNKSG
jgi:Fe-S-cluster containining protein